MLVLVAVIGGYLEVVLYQAQQSARQNLVPYEPQIDSLYRPRSEEKAICSAMVMTKCKVM